ncbi:SMI1/KNR4 family protein [Streptomyces sp. NBC_01498]|uniref:SMI1/KNR4 family protein n=1 Tax=Streptomyces sp. NBC_01498 TaxID=2975870 RepID=UPI002E7C123D|nr:SMI1/KNR4 family protein [Streptomyces sp. NBC_01498]WTL27475.1 SMI1/KNR4 family protein [Streptomyces sp. NBC_01498]
MSTGHTDIEGAAHRHAAAHGHADAERTAAGHTDAERADPADLDTLRAAFRPELRRPPLGWAAVHAYEHEQGVVLPEPYRTLVAEICDGSDEGPADIDGLIPLRRLPADWGADDGQRAVGREFPLTEAWLWEDDPRPYEELEPLIDQVGNDGSVVLGTDGCGLYWHLVVTGPQRGRIWAVGDVGAAPFEGDAGFADWVAHWAERR